MYTDERKVYSVDGFLVTGSFVPVVTTADAPGKALFYAIEKGGNVCKSFKEVSDLDANVKVTNTDDGIISYYKVELA